MNKGYTYVDGKVIITDENGDHKELEFFDNLDKVLVQENVIEEIEDRIDDLSDEVDNYPEANKKFKPYHIYLSLASIVVSYLFIFATRDPFSILYTVGDYLKFFLIPPAVGLSLATIFTLPDYRTFKKNLNERKGIESELEFLKEQLEKEKEKLAELKKEKTRDNENTELRSIKVDDKKQLEDLRRKSLLFHDLGYNEEKYCKSYQEGRLDEVIPSFYSDEENEKAKQFYEEKVKTLVKSKKSVK